MFRKVFKYDFRAMGKFLLLAPGVCALAAAVALIIRLMEQEFMADLIFPELIAGIAVFFSLAAISCFPFAVLFLCLRRYYNHFFSDEGYLTFTLPVRRETLLFSKTFTTMIVFLLSLAVECVAIFLFAVLLPDGTEIVRQMVDTILEILREPQVIPLTVLFAVTLITSLAGGVATMHFSITQGQLLAKKHKVLAAFGIWYGISFIKRLVTQGIGLTILFTTMRFDDLGVGEMSVAQGAMYLYLSLLLVLEIGCLFALYLWNLKLLKNRLALA